MGNSLAAFAAAQAAGFLPHQRTKEIKELLHGFGVWAGGLKRLMDKNGYTWHDSDTPQTNAHINNFVLLGKGGPGDATEIPLGVVDLTQCTKWSGGETMRDIQKYEYERLSHGPSYWRNGFQEGYDGAKLPRITVADLNAAAHSVGK